MLNLAYTSFTGPPKWWKQTTESFWHSNRRARASQDLHNGENRLLNPFDTPVWVSKIHVFRRQFLPWWRSCEARAHQFEYQERSRNQVLPLLKLMHTCLRVGIDLESSFRHCGSSVKLVQVSLSIRNDHYRPQQCVRKIEKAVFTIVKVLWSSCIWLFECQKDLSIPISLSLLFYPHFPVPLPVFRCSNTNKHCYQVESWKSMHAVPSSYSHTLTYMCQCGL